MIEGRIKEILRRKGLTQKDLAERLNVKQETISRQINGNPTLKTLIILAQALRVDVKDFFTSNSIETNENFEYEVITYDSLDQRSQKEFINDKARYGWELVSAVQFTDEKIIPCFRFFFKRKL